MVAPRRKAIEDVLVDFRDSRISIVRNNGLVIREKDGKDSKIIRLGSETALKIGLQAIIKEGTKRMKKLTAQDFLEMPTSELLSWWLFDQMNLHKLERVDRSQIIENLEQVIVAYEVYGREGVSSILGDCGYEIDTPQVGPKCISLAKAKELLTKAYNQNDFRIFYVEFVKRTTGDYRKMKCRFGVRKGLKGVGKSFDDREYDLKTVWDLEAPARLSADEKELVSKYHRIMNGEPSVFPNGKIPEEEIERVKEINARPPGDYRSIALENLVRMSFHGSKYVIEENLDLVSLIK